ncbi:DEAD/DEAH box helicase family protein [Rothia amarae]|uniref:DEAD/DEAH box helicase family protein n=1 Tax=Rothia amarae TaxID=169480 RepID=UPI0012460135
MTNFAFLSSTLPTLAEPARRAEHYIFTDPTSSLFYARRTLELLVDHLYTVNNLPEPYDNKLAARINSPEFNKLVGRDLVAKADIIRLAGNKAVHTNIKFTARDAGVTVEQLFHLLIWAALHSSANPEDVPQQAQFNLNALRQQAEARAHANQAHHSTKAQLQKLQEQFAEEDLKRAEESAEKDREIAELRAQIAEAQRTKQVKDTHDYKESETRTEYIDILLREAGWNPDAPEVREYSVEGLPASTNPSGKGKVDYVLWSSDRKPLAIIEAKRTSKSSNTGIHQAQLYATALEQKTGLRPIIFVSNGYEHQIIDDHPGSNYPARKVAGFLTEDELRLAIARRTDRKPLAARPINTEIAGRPYQIHAITSVAETFTSKKRSALLVMATGTGKTRIAAALIELLQEASWAKRVLFLADRTALVKQATKVLVEHLPQVPVTNLLTEKNSTARVFTCTYPTMLNLINTRDEKGLQRFGPGYFDLIIIDEAHRSVYAKYGEIFNHFDALKVGLTATPKDDIAHNTYRLFEIEDGVPTDVYTLEQAVNNEPPYLVPPKAKVRDTLFLREGVHYEDLSEDDKDAWDEQDWGEGEIPESVEAPDINKYLFNLDTIDKVLKNLMDEGHKVAGGDRLGKTIIFAKSQAHANIILDRFNALFPDLGAGFAAVITHSTSHAQDLIEDFSDPAKTPHVAISVDMLDTGIDVPEVVNLVFFKPVRSKSKYWQMIGRGTRLCADLFGPGKDKENFYVFDWCGNIEFFNHDLPEAGSSKQFSLSERIFDLELQLVKYLDDAADSRIRSVGDGNGISEDSRDFRLDIADRLHRFALSLDPCNVQVRQRLRAVEKFSDAAAWEKLDDETFAQASELAGLYTDIFGSDVDAKRFDVLMHRAQLAVLQGETALLEKAAQNVRQLASDLHGKIDSIPEISAQAEIISAVLDVIWWENVTVSMLESVRKRIRSLVRHVDKKDHRKPVVLDIEDTLSEAREVEIIPHVTGTDIDLFEKKARAYLQKHLDDPALQKVHRNEKLTEPDYARLENILLDAGIAQKEVITDASQAKGGLGLLIRSLVGLDAETARSLFADFLHHNTATTAQMNYINTLIDELTRTGYVPRKRLVEPPYKTNYGTPATVFGDERAKSLGVVLDEVEAAAKI